MALTEAPPRAGGVLGHFGLTVDHRLEGWCWNPAAPGERQQIEITLNGAVVQTLAAAQFVEAIRDAGMGDGRCGFATAVPDADDDGTGADLDEQVIEAREPRSGVVLGRVILHAERATRRRHARLAAMEAAMRCSMADPRLGSDARRQAIGLALGQLGSRLATRARIGAAGPAWTPAHQARAAMARCAPVPGPWADTPAIEVIVVADPRWQVTMAALRHAAAMLRGTPAGFAVVMPAAADPVTAALPMRLRHLRLLRAEAGAGPAAAITAAIRQSRAPRVCLVDDPAALVGVALPALAQPGAPALLGSGAWAALAADGQGRGILARLSGWAGAAPPHGIALVAARADLHPLGDLPDDGHGGIDWVDLAARLQAMEVALLACARRTLPGQTFGTAD